MYRWSVIFDTLKNKGTNLYEFERERALYQKEEEFVYIANKYVCPHSFNGYRTPFESFFEN